MSTANTVLYEFIRSFLSASSNASLYSQDHPQVSRLIDAAYKSAREFFQTTSALTLVCLDGEIIINGEPQESSLFLNRLAAILLRNGISHLSMTAGITRDEIETLVTSFATTRSSITIPPLPHITAGTVAIKSAHHAPASPSSYNTDESSGLPPVLSEMPGYEFDRFMELYETLKERKKLKINGIVQVVSGFIDAFQQQGEALLTMATLRDADEYTFTHSTNVCILTIAQATALGIEGQQLRDFGIAAMLHDIGKLFIPEEIVTKKGALTHDEFAIMSNHPMLGARHLLSTPGVPRLAITTAFEHHLKYDLSGYPAVPVGYTPTLCSHLTMIADFFDALRTRRSYREPVAMREIAGMMLTMCGKELHPGLTRNFLRILARILPARTTQ